MNARRVLIVLGLVLTAAAAAYALRPAGVPAVDFVDSLTGPDSEHLDIPFEKYTLTPEGLWRAQAASGRGNGTDRPVVRTRSAGYLERDFVFEVDIAFPPDVEDIAFIGFGAGAPAPPFNEPSGVFGFRIHHLPGNRDVDFGIAAEPHGDRGLAHLLIEKLGSYPAEGGRFTVRLERAGDHLTCSLPGQDGSERTVRMSAYPSVLKKGYLYLTNTAEGAIFSNVRVRPRI